MAVPVFEALMLAFTAGLDAGVCAPAVTAVRTKSIVQVILIGFRIIETASRRDFK
jgi:hypothetical protein